MIFKGKNSSTIAENTMLARLKSSLGRSNTGLGNLFLGKKQIDADFLQSLEDCLLIADVGVETTESIIQQLKQQISRSEVKDQTALLVALKKQMQNLLQPYQQPLNLETTGSPFILLVIGVNGAGKTTTIGKLAQQYQNEGKNVMLAAGDTFRAAAVEQLQAWGARNKVPVIAQDNNADSAAVIFDAVNAAQARDINLLIADTAGRLHTQTNLMEELKKIVRVIKKAKPNAPHETLLVLDASSGQNALQQAINFKKEIDVSGIVLTKLDGTAKGGIIFAITTQLQLPIRFIGIGENITDLQPFNAEEFVNALLEPITND